MKAILLAGGSGTRMGALTTSTPKANLTYKSRPLIAHFIDLLLTQSIIDGIVISTGYRGSDVVEMLVRENYTYQRKIDAIHLPNIKGTLSRLTATISAKGLPNAAIVLGIDSLISSRVFDSFTFWLESRSDTPALLISPEIEIAPTHPRVSIDGEMISKYSLRDEMVGASFCDIGIRYFPASTLREMFNYLDERERNGCYIPEFLKHYVKTDNTLKCHTFFDDWKHFAYPHDLTT